MDAGFIGHVDNAEGKGKAFLGEVGFTEDAGFEGHEFDAEEDVGSFGGGVGSAGFEKLHCLGVILTSDVEIYLLDGDG